jgi:hypothetical protein
MSEPLAAVAGRDAITSAADDPTQVVGGPRRVPAEMLFLERPARLDRIEVGRVG